MMQETYELFLNLKNGLHSKIDVFNKMLDTIQKEKRIIEGEKTFNSFDEWLTSHILFFGNDVIYRAKKLELNFGNPNEYFLFFPEINKIDYVYIDLIEYVNYAMDEGLDFGLLMYIYKNFLASLDCINSFSYASCEIKRENENLKMLMNKYISILREAKQNENDFLKWLNLNIFIFRKDSLFRGWRMQFKFSSPSQMFIFFEKLNRIEFVDILNDVGGRVEVQNAEDKQFLKEIKRTLKKRGE
ncbi:MAG: hypothetical protein WBI45_09535 [Defluviitoga tunisiensis]